MALLVTDLFLMDLDQKLNLLILPNIFLVGIETLGRVT